MPKFKQPSAKRAPVKLLCVVIAMPPVMSLSACATRPPPPCEMPANPQPPAQAEPLPSKSYSISVQELLQAWRKSLTDTPPTSER